jgi:hypothetical protein
VTGILSDGIPSAGGFFVHDAIPLLGTTTPQITLKFHSNLRMRQFAFAEARQNQTHKSAILLSFWKMVPRAGL